MALEKPRKLGIFFSYFVATLLLRKISSVSVTNAACNKVVWKSIYQSY